MVFADSLELLRFHWMAYTLYSLMIISIVAWFGYNLTRQKPASALIRIPFYGYMSFLILAGVGHHIFTYNAIPWVSEDIRRHHIIPDQIIDITVGKDPRTHEQRFLLPQTPLRVQCHTKVLFRLHSEDLTYGFGLFRPDHTMVTQMQVNPHGRNDLLWTFNQEGNYTILSTEYSGPAGVHLEVKNGLIVEGCGGKQ